MMTRIKKFNPMHKTLKQALASTADSRLLGVVVAVVVIGTLYFARVVFIPLALALLVSLVLTPPVAFLERIRLPRALAIFLVVGILVGLTGLIGWTTSQQFVDLTGQLPSYKKTLEDNIHSLQGPSSQSLTKASNTVKKLTKEIDSVTPGAAPATTDTKKVPTAAGSVSQPLAV